jgi:GH25 family lysozyme M1 (1,4-beta-N-acetylmuramidase)
MPLLRLGSRGPDVAELQTLLTRAGFRVACDSVFGPLTESAVRSYQGEFGLRQDGIAGDRTMASLRAEMTEDTDPAIVLDDLGVDVSQFAGVPDYHVLATHKDGPFRFVIPRIGTGTSSVDTLAARQITEGKAAGFEVPAGYFYVQSSKDGVLQAEHAVRTAEAFGLPAVFEDIEPAKGYDKVTKQWIVPSDAPRFYREVAIAHLDRMLAIGFPFGVYGGDFVASLNLPERFAKVVFWDAAYGPHEHQVKPFGPPAIWQYEGNVEVAGAVVDYNRAFGGLAAVKRALGTG